MKMQSLSQRFQPLPKRPKGLIEIPILFRSRRTPPPPPKKKNLTEKILVTTLRFSFLVESETADKFLRGLGG